MILALVAAPLLGFAAALIATLLCLGRYLAISAFARGIDRGRWMLPLNAWLVLLGLLAFLLYLSGRKGVILWPALVALSGPIVFLVASFVRGILGVIAARKTGPVALREAGALGGLQRGSSLRGLWVIGRIFGAEEEK